MKTVLTTLFFVLVGLGIVGLIHGSLSIVLTNLTAVKQDAELILVICIPINLPCSSWCLYREAGLLPHTK